jgi:type I restriction enzyme, S subunit
MRKDKPIPKGYKSSPLGPIPGSWQLIELGEAIVFPKRQVDPKTYPYHSWSLIAPNHIESDTGRLINIETAEQ